MDSLSDIQQKLMDHLNRKSYSRTELVQKLVRSFSEEEAIAACDWAAGLGLIERSEEMAERYAVELSRKGKGPEFIAAALLKKGLPLVGSDPENELENARQALQKKFRVQGPLPSDLGRKAVQFLSQRGFNQETIRQAVGNIDYEDYDPTTSS